MEQKSQTAKSNLDEFTLSFEDYIIDDEIKFKILCFFQKENILTAYEFADDISNFELITQSFLQKQKPNSFVDFYYVYVTNKNILQEAKDILINLPISKEEIKNVALFYYDLDKDNLTEIISAVQNDNYLYQNYIKPTEIKKIMNLRNNQNNYSNLENDIKKNIIEKQLNNTQNNIDDIDNVVSNDLKENVQLDDFISTTDTKQLINYNNKPFLDEISESIDSEIDDEDFFINEEPLIESIENYTDQLNVTQKLLDDFEENITSSTDELNNMNTLDLDNLDLLDSDSSDKALHKSLLEKSDYFRTLDEITTNLSDDNLLTSETDDILDYLSNRINTKE
ncbi:hypothetical protein [Mycoplasmoides alvi]|uniref:hypothetical protein n=1 Tax=Mycoplasmoides alvi TaxID=78580 RepID=UPI00051B130A|nr:hypothetical protein [Mycoplasmoides alvi]